MDHMKSHTNPVTEGDIIDIEEYALADKKVPKDRKYRIRIDKIKYVVDEPSLTGRQILELAQKEPPERFQLNQKFKGGRVEPIGLDDDVDFTHPGIERFMTVPLDQNEG